MSRCIFGKGGATRIADHHEPSAWPVCQGDGWWGSVPGPRFNGGHGLLGNQERGVVGTWFALRMDVVTATRICRRSSLRSGM
jgi:hypothetical protein